MSGSRSGDGAPGPPRPAGTDGATGAADAAAGMEPGATGPDRAISRRRVLKVLAVTAAAPAVLGGCGSEAGAPGSGTEAAGPAGGTGDSGAAAAGADARPGANYVGNPMARGDAWDPDLVKPVVRWEGKLDDDELETLRALCDTIIPADEVSPSAGSLGAQHYIDEWVSAPYAFAESDLVLVRGGIRWLDMETARRFSGERRFRDLDEARRGAICDDICSVPEAAPEHRMPARFFDKVRDLTATAFYTTDEGMRDLGYVGNVPLAEWSAPPDEVLRHVGLEP